MTQHPAKGMTKAQIAAFDQIAAGNALPPMNQKTLDALVDNGLIVHAAPKVLRDRYGEYRIPQYEATHVAHYEWCQWCAENVGDDE